MPPGPGGLSAPTRARWRSRTARAAHVNGWRSPASRCHRRCMEIIPLDQDDDVMLKELHGVAVRSQAVSRVQPVQRTEEEFLKMVRFDYPGERTEGAVAVVDG